MSTVKVSLAAKRAHEFACHSSACRPPGSGGTGGSGGGGGRAMKAGHGMGNAQGTLGKARYVRSDGTPVSKGYSGTVHVRSGIDTRPTSTVESRKLDAQRGEALRRSRGRRN